MNDPQILGLLFLLTGLILGGLFMWLYLRLSRQQQFVSKSQLEKEYVLKAIHDSLQHRTDILVEDLREKEEEIRALTQALSSKDQTLLHLDDRLRNQTKEIEQLQKNARLEFEQLANRLFEEKSQTFSSQSANQLTHLLAPLKERIRNFESGIEKRFLEETRDRISLKKEIEHLRLLNNQLSQDAANLARALTGDQKTQGDWGEVQLETLLQKAGLEKGIHYRVQNSFADENGRQKRPDFIINLPGDKHLIIDAKVSLTAYEQFINSEDESDRELLLRNHLQSLRRHIKDLSRKNYQQLYQINSPDYLLLFIPIEPAFTLAVSQDQQLFTEALDHNIVLVSTSTLLATMRTVTYIWKQEKQKSGVLEIARQSGLLYDKFCSFVENLQEIGFRLDQANSAYHDAMRKLQNGKKKGDTLIGRAEKIKELGAQTTKKLPKL